MKSLKSIAYWWIHANVAGTIVNISVAHGASLYWIQFGLAITTSAAAYLAKSNQVDTVEQPDIKPAVIPPASPTA